MGGKIAEELTNGQITSGAQDDIQSATSTAKAMVEEMGMSDLVGPRNSKDAGPDLKKRVDDEVDRILQEQYQRGYKMILENKDLLDKIASELMAKESLDG